MKVSEHFGEFHKAALAHHTAMVGAHDVALGKAKDNGEHLTAFHKSAMASHQQMCDYHEAAMEECSKAIAAADLAKASVLVPDQVRGLIPPAPRLVPRAGQREVQENAVDLEFEKMLAIETGE